MLSKLTVRLIPAIAVAAGAVLSGCSSTTYGTGVTPGKQTLEDIVGIASFGGKKQEPIDYAPRPPIVTPPSTAVLPTPGDPNTASVGANWPQDPDVIARQRKAAADAKVATWEAPTGSKDPKFRLPKQQVQQWEPLTDKSASEAALTTPEQAAKSKKLFADARGMRAGSVDANGNPVRQYLIEPPSDYRAPDPTEPTEIVDKPKKKSGFKWPWQWFH
jgi:hypothetical protein